jgi:hypothetical protein
MSVDFICHKFILSEFIIWVEYASHSPETFLKNYQILKWLLLIKIELNVNFRNTCNLFDKIFNKYIFIYFQTYLDRLVICEISVTFIGAVLSSLCILKSRIFK